MRSILMSTQLADGVTLPAKTVRARGVLVVLAVAVLLGWSAGGCSTSSGPRNGASASRSSAVSTPVASPPPASSTEPGTSTRSSAASPSTNTSSALSPSGSLPASSSAPSAAAARLIYATPAGMNLATFTAAGKLIGSPRRIGPADEYSTPIWSPKGRYVAWTVRKADAANSSLELYDSTKQTLAEANLAADGQVSGDGTGAALAYLDQQSDGHLVVVDYDRTGHPKSPHVPLVGGLAGDVAIGHDIVVVASADPTMAPGAPHPLLLVVGGTATTVGQVTALPFLGMQITPGISLAAVRSDDSQLAVGSQLAQDGDCAPGGVMHLIDVAGRSDRVVPLPADPAPGAATDGTVRLTNASYAPDGTLGGILTNCGFEGADKANVFVELHGTGWQRVLPDAVVATRGPGGLLASQSGRYQSRDGATEIVLSAPLKVTNPAGSTAATLTPSWYAAWAPSAIPPD